MAIASVRCPVKQALVTRVTDLEGQVTKVICADYDEPTGICRLKHAANQSGPLAQLLTRAQEEFPVERGSFCDLRAH